MMSVSASHTTAAGARTEADVADEIYGGYKPTAIKRGRNPKYPYVPVVDENGFARQIRGRAYASRSAAIKRAEQQITAYRSDFIERLKTSRAMRESYGLAAIAKTGGA